MQGVAGRFRSYDVILDHTMLYWIVRYYTDYTGLYDIILTASYDVIQDVYGYTSPWGVTHVSLPLTKSRYPSHAICMI